ncbi:hypothetical protein AMK22_13680 [Streptomyces sp. CB01580]|nr:hypothetical protein AMK22_13680 [Streptomyces sp. CB01580]
MRSWQNLRCASRPYVFEVSDRTYRYLVFLLAGVFVGYLAYRDPAAWVALLAGVAVVTLLYTSLVRATADGDVVGEVGCAADRAGMGWWSPDPQHIGSNRGESVSPEVTGRAAPTGSWRSAGAP